MSSLLARRRSLFALAAALAAGCSLGDGTATAPPGEGGAPPSVAPGAGSGARDGGAATGDATTTSFRVAHVAPDLGLLDFCYRVPHGDAYVGPVLTVGPALGTSNGARSRASARVVPAMTASDGGLAAPALTFGSVTGYVAAAGSGTFTIALVAADSHSCSSPLLEAKVTLDAGKRATIAVMGRAGADAAALSAIAFVDDPAADPTATRVRMIHAALGDATHAPTGPLAAAWMGSGAARAEPLAGEIVPMHASTARSASPAIDALGYASIAPVDGPSGAIRLDGLADAAPVSWSCAWSDLGLVSGAIHTGFVATASPLVVVWCDDSTAGAPFTRCATLAP